MNPIFLPRKSWLEARLVFRQLKSFFPVTGNYIFTFALFLLDGVLRTSFLIFQKKVFHTPHYECRLKSLKFAIICTPTTNFQLSFKKQINN